ncbi:MAG: DNA photolyase family protein [Ferruginibacter sp.]|nr:DNA photolyase family protein [Ferruginibacter sp.]
MKVNIFWFRRDIRLEDNAALYYALKSEHPVIPLFIFDNEILDKLENKKDSRVTFIHDTLLEMQEKLIQIGSSMLVMHSTPYNAFKQLTKEYNIENVFSNRDYEPYATERDDSIAELLKQYNIPFHLYKDHVIFEQNEVLKDDGKPYTVFTPYSRKWKTNLTDKQFESYPTEKYFDNFFKTSPKRILSLEAIGFKKTDQEFPSKSVDAELVKKYAEKRNFPGIRGTSHLGLHLRFGTISIRKLAKYASPKSETYLNELIWRDFYQMILWHFPRVGKGKSFKPAYDYIKWRDDEAGFKKWCDGQTGYPIVDAGMRELNETGFMHNRIRMVTASFLCKHLLIDWRLGEAYFAEKLLDFDLASNNGGWQWAAGSGCDAAPYFRIFNPYLQTKKFDADFKYIRKWVPEFEELTYPKPIVEHSFARERCLKVYKEGLEIGNGQ